MVKIPKESRWTQATIISFVGTVAAATAIFLLWSLWPTPAARLAYQRDLRDATVRWRCPGNHTFDEQGSTTARSCPICGQPADIVMIYSCPNHGEIEVFLRYRTMGNGRSEPAQYSFDAKEWHDLTQDPGCPQCGRSLGRKPSSVPRTN